jgi:hypothetical protein
MCRTHAHGPFEGLDLGGEPPTAGARGQNLELAEAHRLQPQIFPLFRSMVHGTNHKVSSGSEDDLDDLESRILVMSPSLGAGRCGAKGW